MAGSTTKDWTAERRANLSASLRGRIFSTSHCEAIAAALRGKKKTQAHREAIGRGVNRWLRARNNDSDIIESLAIVSAEDTVSPSSARVTAPE